MYIYKSTLWKSEPVFLIFICIYNIIPAACTAIHIFYSGINASK